MGRRCCHEGRVHVNTLKPGRPLNLEGAPLVPDAQPPSPVLSGPSGTADRFCFLQHKESVGGRERSTDIAGIVDWVLLGQEGKAPSLQPCSPATLRTWH